MKRRLLKILLTAVAVMAFTGYFAFSTFLFSPTEGEFEPRISTLIPRDVDFYLAKADLAEDFDAFPQLAVMDEFERSEAGQTLFASPEWQAWRAEIGLAETLDAIQNDLAALPLEVAPLEVIGGRNLAVAGYFRGTDLAQSDWAIYARGNWMAKLAFSLLRYPSLSGLESQGISAIVDGEVVSLSGGGLPRTIHVTRRRDVIVASTSLEMIAALDSLIARSGEDSFGGSARYYDHIQQRASDGNETEVFVDYRSLSEAKQYTGRWPDQMSEDFGPALMGRLFQSGALKELVGIVGFDGGMSIDLHGEFSSELVSPFQKQLYRQRGFDRDKMEQAAKLVPRDSGLFAYLHAPFGALLRQILAASERALQDNLDDLVREVWAYPDKQPLIEDLDKAFHDRVALVLRTNDYNRQEAGAPQEETGPPHDDTPVFAWALILWVDDANKIEEVRRHIIDNQGYFGIQGREPGDSGVFTNELRGGQVIHEYWSPFIPGTGHIASVLDQDRFILSNSFKMLEQVLKTWFEGAPTYPRLSEESRFRALSTSALSHANLAIWARPEGLAGSLRDMARRAAEDQVDPNWTVMRGQIDRRVLRENFPDWDYDSLTEDQASQLEVLAVDERNRYERDLRNTQVPAIQGKYERQIVYLEAISGILLEIALDPKKFDLCARVLLPLEE